MRLGLRIAVVVAAALIAACAPRAPIVTNPAYPEFLFPTVPSDLVAADVVEAHEAAWAYLQAGQLTTAGTRYEDLLEDEPSFYPAEAGLGWVHLARGNANAASARFSRAREAHSSYVPALVGSGEAFLALDQPEDALASFEAAVEADDSLTYLRQTIDELSFAVVSQRLSAARAAAADGRYDEAGATYQRVLDTSPESGFLYIELARLERQRGDADRALDHARRAIELDRFDSDALMLEGEILEEFGDLDGAMTSYERADAIDPSEENTARIDRVHERIRMAELPDEIREIPEKSEVTRGDLAALLGVRLGDLLAAGAGQSVIFTDAREHWGGEWIQAVADAGVMDVDPAYRFNPARPVRRSELADIVDAALDLIEEQSGRDVDAVALVPLTDMRPSHLSYAAATRAVALGILDLLENDTFRPAQTVTGPEAVAASERLAALNSDVR